MWKKMGGGGGMGGKKQKENYKKSRGITHFTAVKLAKPSRIGRKIFDKT